MKAIVLTGLNEPFAIQEVEKPKPLAGEVLIAMKAAGLNRRDWWIKVGKYAGIKCPSILGSDGAGIVTEIGDGVDSSWIGKEVVINPSNNWGDNDRFQQKEFKILGLPDAGTFAEYVLTREEYLHAKPEHLNWEQAAAFPLAGLTAYRALFTKGQAQKGDTVLIVGAGGGAATFALQWALAIGCRVFVTSGSDQKIEKAVQLGAVGGANYHSNDWDEQLRRQAGGFDVVIDSALGDGFAKLPGLCNSGARIVFFGATTGTMPALDPRPLFWKQLTITGTTMGTSAEFKAMLNLLNEKKIVPVIDEVLPFDQVEAAFAKMDNSSQFGKIVLRMGM